MKLNVVVYAAILWCCFAAVVSGVSESPAINQHALKEQFEAAYDRYKNAPEPDPGRIHSSRLSTEARLAQGQMVDLGPAVTPLLMKKLKETKDPNLCIPIMHVTKKKFEEDEWPEGRLRTNEVAMSLLLRWWESKGGACAAQTPTGPPQFSIKARFDDLFRQYEEAPDEPFVNSMGMSSAELRCLQQMIKLGPAVTPYLMEKLRETKDADLTFPIWSVTRKRFKKSEWPEGIPPGRQKIAQLYLDWWESKVENARSEFEKAYSRWQETKSSESWPLLRVKRYVYDSEHQRIREKEELTEAGKALHSMEMMGVVALPYVMEHLREGDHDLLVLAERLTGDAVRAGGPPKARAERYLAWWKKNERE